MNSGWQLVRYWKYSKWQQKIFWRLASRWNANRLNAFREMTQHSTTRDSVLHNLFDWWIKDQQINRKPMYYHINSILHVSALQRRHLQGVQYGSAGLLPNVVKVNWDEECILWRSEWDPRIPLPITSHHTDGHNIQPSSHFAFTTLGNNSTRSYWTHWRWRLWFVETCRSELMCWYIGFRCIHWSFIRHMRMHRPYCKIIWLIFRA
jgi:hypothetical protein